MKINVPYDDMGQRIAKTVTNKNVTTGDKFVTTYYVRDPRGNVLAVYEKKEDAAGAGQFQLKERHLYGMNRLGMVSQNVTLAQFDNSNVTNGTDPTTPQAGDTHYELTNHLGNVMAVISDTTSTTSEPTVVSLSDYYPFGMEMPRRNYSNGEYRYGFNGKEKDDANGIHLDFGARIYDSRIGRFLSVDPKVSNTMASYSFAGNNPIGCIDYEGKYKVRVTKQAKSEGIDDESLKPLFTVLNCMSEILKFSGVMEEIVKQTGFTKEDIEEKFSYDDETINLTIRSYDEHSATAKQKDDGSGSWEGIDMQGGLGNGGNGNQVEIAVEVIQQLNNVLNNPDASKMDKAATALAVGLLILHETIHEMDFRTNDELTNETPGKQNSKSVFNHRPLDVVAAVFGLKNIDEKYWNSTLINGLDDLMREGNNMNLRLDLITDIFREKTHGGSSAAGKIVRTNQKDMVGDKNRNQRLNDTGTHMIENVPENGKKVEYEK